MLSVLMLSLLIPVTDVADMPMTAFSQQGDPPVKLWLSKDRVQLGDRVQVDVRTESDGYLLVLHAEPDGRVRVLFPIDPIQDNFVRGGDEFEVRGRGDRETFRVYSSEGVGTVYAAFSRDPFQFAEFVRGDHWDYGVRDVWYVVDDPEPEITDLVLSLASGAYFDYDFVQYGAGDAVVAAGQRAHLSLYADPYSYNTVGVGINVGGYYDPFWSYGPYWRIGFMGWPSHRYARSACWRGLWNCYDPYYGYGYGSGYYGYGYGYGSGYYGYGYGSGYGYGYPDYRYRNPTVVVYGDNRLRTSTGTRRLQPSNGATRGRRVYAGALGSTVRQTSAVSRVSPAARRVAASSVNGSRTPQRATATAAAGRRTVDSPRTAPAQRVTTATARRTTESTAARAVNATAQQPQRRTTGPARTTRQATPTREAATAPRATPSRQTPVTTRRTTPTRVTTSRPATTRSAPSRVTTSRPATTRSAPSRATTSRPTTSRSAPSRVTTSRPTTSRSAPSRATTSRPTTSRSAPSRATTSRPTASRSAPARATSRPSTSRSTPARTSSSSARSTTRKPTTTTRRIKP
jgi:hypothetical protein